LAEDKRKDSQGTGGSAPASESGGAGGTIRLVIADDHALFRESLARVLGQNPEFEVAGVASTADEAVGAVAAHCPDIVLLDVAMPGGGIEAIRDICRTNRNTRVVMLSAHGYEHYVTSSLRAGAVGYITKTATVDYLCAALKMVHRGEIVCDYDARSASAPGERRKTVKEPSKSPSQAARLNPREVDILREVAKGMGNRATATKLGISERTVQAHLMNAFGKLGVRTRTSAVMRCVSSGLIAAEEVSD
jgi:DNA-binding NarL/FixJ family response regulator